MMSVALAVALAAPPLTARVTSAARADGRTTAQIELADGPEPLEGEDPALADEGSVSCDGAAVIPPARVLVPAAAAAREVSCRARRRGEEAAFSFRAEPAGPGLYATLLPDLSIDPFRLGKEGRGAPRSLRMASSAGAIEGDHLRLPPGRAPRALAVALLDDEGEGAVFLPVPGRTQLHLESKRRALLSVRIAGAIFGPVRAPEGKATLPVLVPPGVQKGVVRAVDRLGNARELPVDLDTPDLRRIAAVISSAQVVAGGDLRIAVALAAADGAPAENASLRAAAGRGTLQAPGSSGPGLYVARYRAPPTPGVDRIAIDVPSDPSAGRAELSVEVIAGPPADISIETPAGPLRAGEELMVHARVRDAAGNALSGVPLQASLGDLPARVGWEGAIASVAGRVPENLPSGDAVELSVQAGGAARAAARIPVLPSEASAAELRADASQRSATVHALVRDRFGNPLGASGFTIAAQGAAVGPLHTSAAGAAEADLEADPRARSAETSVVAGGRVLARAKIVFQPPPGAWLGTAWINAGAMSNGGAVRAPRGGAGIGLRRQFGRIEGALLFGLDALWYRADNTADIGGVSRTVSQRLFALSFPLLLRGRLPFARRWGASLEAGAVAEIAWASAASDVSSERLTSLVPGFRARAAVDYSLGRSRIALGATWGTAKLKQGPLLGEFEGYSLFLGYEAWVLDLGP